MVATGPTSRHSEGVQKPSRTIPVQVCFSDGDAHTALVRLVTSVTGDPAPVLAHACRSCGSDQHGQPVVNTTIGRVHVSLSRPAAGGPSVCAVCLDHPIGIDLEAASAIGLPEVQEVACHPAETWVQDDANATRLWVAKEALLKAYGQGLLTDPRTIRLTSDGKVLVGPPANIVEVDLGPDWVCAVAVATETGSVELVQSAV